MEISIHCKPIKMELLVILVVQVAHLALAEAHRVLLRVLLVVRAQVLVRQVAQVPVVAEVAPQALLQVVSQAQVRPARVRHLALQEAVHRVPQVRIALVRRVLPLVLVGVQAALHQVLAAGLLAVRLQARLVLAEAQAVHRLHAEALLALLVLLLVQVEVLLVLRLRVEVLVVLQARLV